MNSSSVNENKKDTTNIVGVLFRGEASFGEYFHSADEHHRESNLNTFEQGLFLNNLKDNLKSSDEKVSNSEDKSIVPGDLQEGETQERRRTIMQRMFSSMEAGSLRASIFGMCSLALGAGSLSLPQVMTNMSLVLGIIMLILGAVSAYWSLIIMIKASLKEKEYNYSKLIEKVLGRPASIAFDIVIIIYSVGVIISYEVSSKI